MISYQSKHRLFLFFFIFEKHILINCFSKAKFSQYWNSQSKYILISTERERNSLARTTSFFYSMGLLDVIIIGQDGIGLQAISYNPFEKEALERVYDIDLKKLITIEIAFPDKLKNLHKYQYKSVFIEEYPEIFYRKTQKNSIRLTGMSLIFIKTVTQHQNATAVLVCDSKIKGRDARLMNALKTKTTDLILNTHSLIEGKDANKFKLINTYETDGFCVMLPFPPRKSVFDFIMKPFDLWTWILIMLTVTCLVIVWHYLTQRSELPNPDTTWFVMFAFFAFFLSQGVRFHQNRLLQKILVQLMVMTTFILGNIYQSELTSYMLESRVGNKIASIDEMMSHNYTFQVDPLFMKKLNRSEAYVDLIARVSKLLVAPPREFENLASKRVGLIVSCNHVDLLYRDANVLGFSKDAVNYYYRVPGKLFPSYLSYITAPYSVLAYRLHEYSLRIHESGKVFFRGLV